MPKLTERQHEIKRLLDSDVGAVDIAEKLGITRNAVYQQIHAIRKKGLLPEGYTPSGEVRISPNQPHPASQAGQATNDDAMRVISTLVTTNAQLADVIERLTAGAGVTADG